MNGKTPDRRLPALSEACRQLNALIDERPQAQLLLGHIRAVLATLEMESALQSHSGGDPLQGEKNGSADDKLGLSSARQVEIEVEELHRYEEVFNRLTTNMVDVEQADAGHASFDLAALSSYLSSTVFPGSSMNVTAVTRIAGGFSKLTLRATLTGPESCPPEVVLRLDQLASQSLFLTQVGAEYPLLQTLHRAGIRVPKTHALESTGAVLGSAFLVMESVAGVTVGSHFEFPAADSALAAQIAGQLARIHGLPVDVVSLQSTQPIDIVDEVRTEIENLQASWAALSKSSAIIDAGFRTLRANIQHASGALSLVHGDFGLHNILIEDGKLSAILDWEFARIGNPANDLGWFYYGAEHIIGWDTFMADYRAAGGPEVSRQQIDFYKLLGALRLAILCAQVGASFNAGQLKGIHYAIPGSRYLRTQLLRVADALRAFEIDLPPA